MPIHKSQEFIAKAVETVAVMSGKPTDGIWLEVLVTQTASAIARWDISACWRRSEWPDRVAHGLPKQDVGIDVVARSLSVRSRACT